LQRWRRLAKHQLAIEPLCRSCKEQGRITPAAVADHIVDHKGDWNRFILGELQSLCASCHAQKNGVVERGYSTATGVDGLPIDPRHPFNVG
jgi:5-methylcytosine-specific restriction endonuclease McrA